MSRGRCAECGMRRKLSHEDPRSAPLEEGNCLCEECFEVALIERATELAGEISWLFDQAADSSEFARGEIKSEIEGAMP